MPLPVAYTTVDDVLRVATAVGSISNVNSVIVYGFIGEAEAMLNARLANLYTLPISGANPGSGSYPLLQVLATDLTIYRMMSRRIMAMDRANKSAWIDRFSEANSVTWEVQIGRLPIVDSSGSVLARNATMQVWSNTSAYLPTFDVGDQFWQDLDKTRLYDIESAKDVWLNQAL